MQVAALVHGEVTTRRSYWVGAQAPPCMLGQCGPTTQLAQGGACCFRIMFEQAKQLKPFKCCSSLQEKWPVFFSLHRNSKVGSLQVENARPGGGPR